MMSNDSSIAQRPHWDATAIHDPGVDDQLLIEAALRIAARIERSAVRADRRCTWMITNTKARRNRPTLPTVPGGPALYGGTAGIILFLAEVVAATGETRFIPTIDAAMRSVMDDVERNRETGIGFHSGIGGVAYVAQRYAHVSGQERYANFAIQLLRRLRGAHARRLPFDIISGVAGTVPVLLRTAAAFGDTALFQCAVDFGENLISSANRRPVGWSWNGDLRTSALDLTGLAHGAAGAAHALLELYAATNDPAFRFAAEQGFAYERCHFNAAERNWPDFRNIDLFYAVTGDEPSRTEFLATLEQGGPLYQAHCMTTWCHGAPGIALTRLRAYDVLHDTAYAEEARAAVATTVAQRRQLSNFSLCHGWFGNDATLIAASRVLGDNKWREQAHGRACEAAREFELADRPWPCGTIGGTEDPSLMVGLSGIGHHLLSLATPDTAPILLVTVDDQTNTLRGRFAGERVDGGPRVSVERVQQLTQDHVDRFFKQSLGVINRLSSSAPLQRPNMLEAPDVAGARRAIRACVASEPDAERQTLLADGTAVDLAAYDMTVCTTDLSWVCVEALQRRSHGVVDWAVEPFCLSPHVSVVREEYDWAAWFSNGSQPLPTKSKLGPIIVLHWRESVVERVPVGSFAGLLLCAVTPRITLPSLLEQLAGQIQHSSQVPDLSSIVVRQLQVAFDAGFVTLDRWRVHGS